MHEIEHSDRAANIIGIDLGTSTTLVARFNEAGKPEITCNSAGEPFTSSAIRFIADFEPDIGFEAMKCIGLDNVFSEFKREMGTDKSWTVDSKNVTPVDLSALLLKKVVADYEEQFGKPQGIVITWPANFRNEQRDATKAAALKAGLKVEYYIEEPIAATLYYATDTFLDGKYLVYDFGGGTFDVTLIEAHGNSIAVLYQDGVQQLGGKDLDLALIKIIGEKFRAKTGDEFDAVDCNFNKLDVESVKRTLTSKDMTAIRLVSAKHGPSLIEITRKEFEAGISHLVSQVEMACENVLRRGKDDPSQHVKKSAIKEIFMVGEISLVPAFQASVERLFGKKPKVKNPSHAVALGAAIYAAHKASPGTLNTLQAQSVADIDVSLIAPNFYGLIYTNWLTGEARNITLIRKGEILPFKRTYKVNADRRGYLPTICLTQSAIEEVNADFVTTIWEGELHRCAPNAEIDLVFSYDELGTMCFSVTEVATGKCTKVDLSPGE